MARILVAGAGAIGSVFGGLLSLCGHEVTLLGRADHMGAISRQGLRIQGIWGNHRCQSLRVATSPAECGTGFDAVLVTVKSYDTANVAALLPQWVHERCHVISLQNGLGNLEILARWVNPVRVLGGRVIFGARVVCPGVSEVTVSAEPVRVGAYRPSNAAANEAAALWAATFSKAGIAAEPCGSIQAELWSKVFYNAALNPLGALLRCDYGWLAQNKDTRAIMNCVIDEAFAVAKAERVPLRWESAESYRAEFYSVLVQRTATHRSSMLQDLERGKQTEIDAINGEVWKRGRRHGLLTPFNALLTRLVHAAAKRLERADKGA